MLNVTVENIGELAVVECEGRIVQSDSAYKLRKAVTSLTDARIVVLELSEVSALGGAASVCSCFCNDGHGKTTSGSCCSIHPNQSRAHYNVLDRLQNSTFLHLRK